MQLKYIESSCSGCRTCQLACSLTNFNVNNPSKSALKVEGRFPGPGDYMVHVCDQCGECAEACPVGAITLENGTYAINNDECIGCMACVRACTKGVMMEHEDFDKPFKCTNCGACVEICPRSALEFVEKEVK